ncbi:MAG: GatB/YqeY domain-containing protein [Bacillota bacterium]
MTLSQRLFEEQKQAMKGQDKFRLNLICCLRSDLKYAGIAKKGPLSEEDEQAVLQREVKRRKEALADYTKMIVEKLLG